MSATLAEVIHNHLQQWELMIVTESGGLDEPDESLSETIAAAVAAHLASPAVVERVLSALVHDMQDAGLEFDHLCDASEHPLHRDRDDVLTVIKAALAAAVGGAGTDDK